MVSGGESALDQCERADGDSERSPSRPTLLFGRIIANNTTALSYLRNQGRTHLVIFNSIVSQILLWAEKYLIELRPQFVMWKKNVLADTLSRSRKVLGAEWTLHQEVVQSLVQKWPVNVVLFAACMNFKLPTYFSPISGPQQQE